MGSKEASFLTNKMNWVIAFFFLLLIGLVSMRRCDQNTAKAFAKQAHAQFARTCQEKNRPEGFCKERKRTHHRRCFDRAYHSARHGHNSTGRAGIDMNAYLNCMSEPSRKRR